ncbi:hypothetical protein GCM10023065_31750 [Microbacterium laevaniformans]
MRADSPSWLAWHPTLPVVYAALEGRGVVQAYRRIGDERFVPHGGALEAGEAVCHIAVAADATVARAPRALPPRATRSRRPISGSIWCGSGGVTRRGARTTSRLRGRPGRATVDGIPPSICFVVTELSNELYALAHDASGQWRVVAGAWTGRGITSSCATPSSWRSALRRDRRAHAG